MPRYFIEVYSPASRKWRHLLTTDEQTEERIRRCVAVNIPGAAKWRAWRAVASDTGDVLFAVSAEDAV